MLPSGCATFRHDWNRAVSYPPPAADLQGPWQGVWASEVNGHNDQLRCVVTKKQDGLYRARFQARYRKVLTFGYTVSLRTAGAGEALKFQGDANLGWYAGGRYHYEGHADATNFFATYSCKYDHGTFRMARP